MVAVITVAIGGASVVATGAGIGITAAGTNRAVTAAAAAPHGLLKKRHVTWGCAGFAWWTLIAAPSPSSDGTAMAVIGSFLPMTAVAR